MDVALASKIKKLSSLDILSFAVAGLRDGVGPLLTLYLIRETHLDPEHLSWVLAAPSLGALIAQIPSGLLYDFVKRRAVLVAFGSLLLGVCSLLMADTTSFRYLLMIQLVGGLAICILSVGLPAITFASTPIGRLPSRLARNEIFSKAGNFFAIAVSGWIAKHYALNGIFYVSFVASVVVALSAVRVREAKTTAPVGLQLIKTKLTGRSVIKDLSYRPFLFLVGVSFLYQYSNAALLSVFEQGYGKANAQGGAGAISTAVIGTQIVIIGATLFLARHRRVGDYFLFIALGFAMIIARGSVFYFGGFTGTLSLACLGVAQLFDGAVAAILILIPLRAIAGFETGRFNLMSGVVGTCVALGATVSTLSSGVFIAKLGHAKAFVPFVATAVIGLIASLVLHWFSVSESHSSQPLNP